MALPRFVLRVVDPAQRFFLDQRRGRGRAPLSWRSSSVPRGGVVFGPGVPGGSRPATPDELAELTERARVRGGDHDALCSAAQQRWAPELHRAAEELVRTGSLELQLGERVIEASIVRFWRGDDVLVTSTRGPGGGGSSRTRLPRRRRTADHVLPSLVRAATKG